MWDIDDLRFRELVEHGVPLERLESRLQPFAESKDRVIELRSHDRFNDYSVDGFLGAEESLLEVVHSDWLVVERYGIGHKEIAEALERAIESRKIPNRNYRLKLAMLTCGVQGCPWECQSQYKRGSMAFFLYDKRWRKYIPDCSDFFYARKGTPDTVKETSEKKPVLRDQIAVVTEIHPHLIGEHYFFEGRTSPYRADPRILIEALGLTRRQSKARFLASVKQYGRLISGVLRRY